MSGAPPPAASAAWTSRAYLLVGVGAGLAVLAVLLGTAVPLFVALPLLLAPFAASFGLPRHLDRADLAWESYDEGGSLELRGTLAGSFEGAANDVEVRLSLPSGAVPPEEVRYHRTPDRIRFAARWTAPEPTVERLVAPTVVWRDPMGLREELLDGRRPDLLLERSPPDLHGVANVKLDRTVALPGGIRARRVGSTGEFFGLRHAQVDEPFRRINWRATARVGRLVANDYQVEHSGDLIVLVDTRPTSRGRAHDERLLGVARAGAYRIADSFLRSKVRIAYASFGEFLDAVPLSTGRIHRARVLQAILASRRAETAGPAARCAVGLRRFYPPGVTTLIVSSWEEDPLFDLVPYVRRQGFPVVMLSPSPLPLREGSGALRPRDEGLARRIEQLERRERLAPLWEFGPVVDWENYWSLEGLLRVLRQPALRRAW